MISSKDLKTLLALSDEIYARYLLDMDFQSRNNIAEDDLIKNSIECGRGIARKYKGLGVGDLIEKFGLQVSNEEGSNSFNFYELAYFEEPNKIVLCENNINLVKNKAREFKEFKNMNVEDIIICHEIFHKIEEVYPEIYTNNVEVLALKFGPIKKYSKVKAASEIGAMAFSKYFLDLDFNPLIISYLLALACGKEKIIYEKIIRRKNES